MRVHVVGFGLAGAWCCYWLHKAGVEVVLHDVHNPSSSTRIAAGMITPITGQRVKPTWRYAELWDIARQHYPGQFIAMHKMRRVFTSQQMNVWFQQRVESNEYDGIDVSYITPGVYDNISFPFGGFEIDGCASVDLNSWLDYIQQRCSVRPVHDEALATIDSEDLVIHAMGYSIAERDEWSWLPLEPSKGEILDVECNSYPDYIVSNGTWIMPALPGQDESTRAHGKRYRIGATNDWDDLSPDLTQTARQRLLRDAHSLVDVMPTVVNHRAAIRPSTQFKRPLVGRHPERQNLYVCTGFGAKGTLFGPWAAQQLISHIVDATPIDTTIDVVQYSDRYRNGKYHV